jgi:hypothetical protein
MARSNLYCNIIDIGASQVAYTPVLTAETTTDFTISSATGAYLQLGSIIFVQASITYTNVGTSAGQLYCSIPVQAASNLTSQLIIGGGFPATIGTNNLNAGPLLGDSKVAFSSTNNSIATPIVVSQMVSSGVITLHGWYMAA